MSRGSTITSLETGPQVWNQHSRPKQLRTRRRAPVRRAGLPDDAHIPLRPGRAALLRAVQGGPAESRQAEIPVEGDPWLLPEVPQPGPGKLSTCPSHFPAPAPRSNSTIRPDIGHHPGTTLQPPANRWPYSQSLTNRRVRKGGLPMNALKFQKNIRVFGDSRETCELVDAAVVDVAGHNGLSPDERGRSHECSSRSPVPESNGAGSSRGVIKPSARGGLSQMRWPRAGREQKSRVHPEGDPVVDGDRECRAPPWASLGRSAAWLPALGAPLPPRAERTACAGGPAPRENTLVRLTCFWLTWSNPPENERQLRLRLDKGWDET